MKMLNGYILIRVDDEVTKTKSGILMQSGAVKLPSRGIVEAVAEGEDTVKIGDHVEFLRYASLDGTDENTRIVKADMIVANLDG